MKCICYLLYVVNVNKLYLLICDVPSVATDGVSQTAVSGPSSGTTHCQMASHNVSSLLLYLFVPKP